MRTATLRTVLSLGVLALLLAAPACEDSDLLAPDDGTLILTANPLSVVLDPDVPDASATVSLSAQLFDGAGFPLESALVSFSATSGVLDSSADDGAVVPIETDANGIARDRLTITLADEDQIEVTARSGLLEQFVTIDKDVFAGDRPPEADIDAIPSSPLEAGNFVTFRGDASSDPDGDPITCYQWEVLSTDPTNDQIYQGPTRRSFTKFYDDEQTLTVTLRVSSLEDTGFCNDCVDVIGGACGAALSNFDGIDFTVTYDIVCDPTGPNAVGPNDQTVTLVGGSVTVPLSGAASSDPESGIVSYSWNCGNGTGDVDGVSINCVYTSPGTFFPTLTVVNGCGDTDTDQVRITVNSP